MNDWRTLAVLGGSLIVFLIIRGYNPEERPFKLGYDAFRLLKDVALFIPLSIAGISGMFIVALVYTFSIPGSILAGIFPVGLLVASFSQVKDIADTAINWRRAVTGRRRMKEITRKNKAN